MADSYDRYEGEGGGGGFMMGLLTGTVLGAGLGMLLAPKAGTELRGQIGEQARNLGNIASDQYRRATEAASGWAEKGREVVGQAREAVGRGVDEARGYAGATTGSTYGTGTSGSSFGGTTGTTERTPGSTTGGGDFGRS
jgi:gas vesicle protein